MQELRYLCHMRRIAIIGGGAAGCFCAIQLKRACPELAINLYEAHPRLLEKVAITGGGRCNLTNSFAEIRSLKEAYPRGERVMQRALKAFSQEDTCRWFTAEGVPLVLQEDQCWFPASQDALDIVRALERGLSGVRVHTNCPVRELHPGFRLVFDDGELMADAVVVTTGGCSRKDPEGFLRPLGLEMVPPVPSLFPFTIADEGLRSLMGLVVPATLSIPGTGFKADGPLLITDWGLSGPATLKLSSYATRYLAECGYKAPLTVAWSDSPEASLFSALEEAAVRHPGKLMTSLPLPPLPARLWAHLLRRAGLREDLRWGELGQRGRNRLVAFLKADRYDIVGRTRFRGEFVTAGGVALSGIKLSTLESRKYPGLYFAGEVLDIDAITGGFNLQAAWSTGFVVAQSLTKSILSKP